MTKDNHSQPYLWKEEYKLNHELFDTQTKKFLEIINLMKELVASGVDNTGISEVFFQLTHYFERFMMTEEIYLKELNYDRLERHYKAHREFMEKIVAFREGFERGDKSFSSDMYKYLENWFDDHMMIDDRRAVNFIKERSRPD